MFETYQGVPLLSFEWDILEDCAGLRVCEGGNAYQEALRILEARRLIDVNCNLMEKGQLALKERKEAHV